jgi:hypothetical protein
VPGNYGKTLNINGHTLEVYGDFVNNSRNSVNANISGGIINTTVSGSHIIIRSNFASFHDNSVINTGSNFLFSAIGTASLQEIKIKANDLQEFKINKPQGRVVVQGFGADRLDVRGDLTIASGGLEMLTGTPLLVNGDFTIEKGSFKSNTSTIVVRGSWKNTGGTADFASGTINFYPANASPKTIHSNGQAFNVVNFGMISNASACPTPSLNNPFNGSTNSPGVTKYTLEDNFTATGLTTVAARGQISGGTLTDSPAVATTAPVVETASDITVTLLGLRIREFGTFTVGQGVSLLNANNPFFFSSSSINPFPSTLGPLGILIESGTTKATNGIINILGWPSNYGKISRDPSKIASSPTYTFRVEGTITARYYLIEYMNTNGIDLNYTTSTVANLPAPGM